MYIFKNAFINIIRTKGRNLLIAVIILAISVSACLGLSIRQAAETAKEESLNLLNITAQISIDRNSIMQKSDGTVDKSTLLSGTNSLSIDELLNYANASSVDSFYYSSSLSLNGSDGISPVDTSTSSDETTSSTPSKGSSGKGQFGTQGDFTVIGYSSSVAMTSFNNGTSTITDGNMFEEGTENLDCIISDELSTFNDLTVGSTIVLTNPNNETETYILNIVGIYNNSQSGVSSSTSMRGFSTANDPANQIYISYNAANSIAQSSTETATQNGDSSIAITSQPSGTYVFSNLDNYNSFEAEARALGLTDTYTISSSDVTAYEQSLVPLENLSTMAGYFLVVVLVIGALILVVLNIFNVRERKYEVGVLTAIGMKKWKVALQFITEILVITLLSVTLGGTIGAASSVPVTNSLLESQVTKEETATSEMTSNYGQGGKGNFMNNSKSATVDYISEVSSAVNITVLLQLLGVFILLAVIASAVSTLFIMRYEPLKILSNRD